MDKCKLCLENDADDTGSHVITYALIKSAINAPGKLKRDNEISFEISSGGTPIEEFFGSKILPEKIEEIKGKILTEEEIANNINPLTVDNFFCRKCEKRFTSAENYFIAFHKKISEQKFKITTDAKGNRQLVITPHILSTDLLRLNIYLQAWRCSVTEHTGFKLNPQFEEKLRKILHTSLDLNLKTTIDNCAKDSIRIRSIPLVMTYLEIEVSSPNQKELTENLISLGKGKIPYYLHLNEFCFQLYEKEKHVKASIDRLHGLREMIDITKSYNYNTGNLKIDILDDANRKKIIESMMKTPAIDYAKELVKIYNEGHLKAFGFLPHPDITKDAIDNILAQEKISNPIRFSDSNIMKISAQHLFELQQYYNALRVMG